MEDERPVVAGVAEAQRSVLEVEEAAERGHEHRRPGFLAEPQVHGLGQPRRVLVVRHIRAEQGLGQGHDQRRSDALARHVADAEVESIGRELEVVQIAADHLRRTDRGVEVERLVVVRDRGAGQHAHLDVAGQSECFREPLTLEMRDRHPRAFHRRGDV